MGISGSSPTCVSRSRPAGRTNQWGRSEEEERDGEQNDFRRQLLGQASDCRIRKSPTQYQTHGSLNSSTHPLLSIPTDNHRLPKAGKNPNSVLSNVPQSQFSSRYADPNHPAASGSLISFVSGGRLVPGPESRGLIGGVASVIDQAVRGVPQGTGKGPQYYDEQGHYGNRYSRGYRGRGRRRDQRSPSRNGGLISGSVGAYKKYLRKVSLLLLALLVRLKKGAELILRRESCI